MFQFFGLKTSIKIKLLSALNAKKTEIVSLSSSFRITIFIDDLCKKTPDFSQGMNCINLF